MTTRNREAQVLARSAAHATGGSVNEASLRHALETALANACAALTIPFSSLELDRALRIAHGLPIQFADAAHGAVVIEYEPPEAFGGRDGQPLTHAREQAVGYARTLNVIEGRPLRKYVLIAWDGADISFGRFEDGVPRWEALQPFTRPIAERLLQHLEDDGRILVNPLVLCQRVGPDSPTGASLLPKLFSAVVASSRRNAPTTKTKLLFTEWRRLFGQVADVQSERLRKFLAAQRELHAQRYDRSAAAYLFALNTYIAFVAKVVAAMSLPHPRQDIANPRRAIFKRCAALEEGTLFSEAGITNMLSGDFFSWYIDDPASSQFAVDLKAIVRDLASLDFDIRRKDPVAARDLFKEMYEQFVPAEMRHALGEYYTPDWLASFAIDQVAWKIDESLLDPTCGSGTFILEAVRRRLEAAGENPSVAEILEGIAGIDINPLAVLVARASLAVLLSPFLGVDESVRLPIYLADAINPAEEEDRQYKHELQTERGLLVFTVPSCLVESDRLYELFARIRSLLAADYSAEEILAVVRQEGALRDLSPHDLSSLSQTINVLHKLHGLRWDGIWCSVLAERFTASGLGPFSVIVGNPPWVKWSNLPPQYAEFIKPRCQRLGVFSEDTWVGGIESDISTVVTYQAVDHWLGENARLGFFITGSVFSNESSQGFRRFTLEDRELTMRVDAVHDFDELRPFDGVSNHPTLLLLQRDAETVYPVPYVCWVPQPGEARPTIRSGADFARLAHRLDMTAEPVPGTDAGPWMVGTPQELALWRRCFAPGERHYLARKGITTDCNGVFFVRVAPTRNSQTLVRVTNNPSLGRRAEVTETTMSIEKDHLFPLLRGRGVRPFSAEPDPDYCTIVPQRGMHGDPNLPQSARRTYDFLSQFEDILRQRSSYRRFQRTQVWWSLWSTGAYTFSEYKVDSFVKTPLGLWCVARDLL